MAFTFISGATGGIGKAFAIASAKKGYDLFLTGRSKDKLAALKAQLSVVNPDIKIDSCACDLSDNESREKMLAYIREKGYSFNRLINVAGVDIQKAFSAYTKEKLLFQIRVNAEATISLTYDFLPLLVKPAEIIIIGSMSGVSPMPYFAVYSATKAMLLNFFTALHYELKKDGVKVTTILPGGVPTRPDVIQAIKEQKLWGKISAKSPEFVAEKSLKAVRKNKIKYIPGAFNKILYFLMKIAPKRLVLSIIAKRWKKISKDAF